MEEESFEKLYNESLNEKKFDKRITGTVIQISRKGEIFVDFKYKADGIIPRKEYSDDETKNPKDEFKPGDTITADVIKWNDGLGNVLLSYKKYRKEEDKKIKFSYYQLRHSYCTMLYYAGVIIKKAQELMGHSSADMVYDIYTHLDEERENASDLINNYISNKILAT